MEIRATGKTTGRNLLFTTAGYAWSALVLVVSVPILVHGLGASSYGVFALASLVLGYAALLDFGLTPAVVRAIAMSSAKSDPYAISRIVGTALSIFIALGAVGGAIIYLSAPWAADRFLHLPGALRGDTIFVLQLTAVGFGLNMVLTLFTAIPQGMQRLDIFSSRTILFSTLTAIGQVAAVVFGGGLRWVAGVTLGVNFVAFVIFVVVSRGLLPGVSIRPRFDRQAFRQLGAFGIVKFVGQLGWLLTFQLDRVIVAAFLPIAQVAYYSVPVTIAQKFTLVQAAFSTAIFPAASEMHALDARDRLQLLYLSATKLVLAVALPPVVLVTLFAKPLMITWLGTAFGEASSGIMAVLALAYGANLLVAVSSLTADATGRPHWTTAAIIAGAILNVSLTLALVPHYGAMGAAYSILFVNSLQAIVFIIVVELGVVRIPPLTILREAVIRPVCAGAGLAIYAFIVRGWIGSFAELILAAVVGLLLYAALALAAGVLNQRERAVAFEILRLRRRPA